MTIVKGQIDSLKKIKAELILNGISRFNSLGEIDTFIQHYENEIQNISVNIKQGLDLELDTLEIDLRQVQADFEKLNTFETQRLKSEIYELSARHILIKSRKVNLAVKLIDYIEIVILKISISRLEKNFDHIIDKRTLKVSQQIQKTKKELIEKSVNKETVISDRISLRAKDLIHTKKVIDGLQNLIAGALGEILVARELQKLSDKNILYNDYSIHFDTPIYNKKLDDRIYSIQIDHLLVTNSGVFVIETKNWSKESLKNPDLRSPIDQVRRTSYALFVLLNSTSKLSTQLRKHHWGEKQIPIRNLVVMINYKPKEKFKHVAVKTLPEVNSYIKYFEPIYDDLEVKRISEFLEKIREVNNVSKGENQKPHEPFKTKDQKIGLSTKQNLQKWLKSNHGKGLNDYYAKFRKK